MDTDLLRIITSTADELSRGTNTDDLEPKIGVLGDFFTISGCGAHSSAISGCKAYGIPKYFEIYLVTVFQYVNALLCTHSKFINRICIFQDFPGP